MNGRDAQALERRILAPLEADTQTLAFTAEEVAQALREEPEPECSARAILREVFRRLRRRNGDRTDV